MFDSVLSLVETFLVVFTRHSCTGRYCWGAY